MRSSSAPNVTKFRRATKRLSAGARSLSPSSVEQDLAAVERELANLTAAVAAGGDVPALVAALRDQEAHRRLLLERLRTASLPTSSPTDILADLQERLTDWRSLLHDETPKARGLLKRLIVGRLNMKPEQYDKVQQKGLPGKGSVKTAPGFYRFEGTGTLEPLLGGIMPTCSQSMASPTGAVAMCALFETIRVFVPTARAAAV